MHNYQRSLKEPTVATLAAVAAASSAPVLAAAAVAKGSAGVRRWCEAAAATSREPRSS